MELDGIVVLLLLSRDRCCGRWHCHYVIVPRMSVRDELCNKTCHRCYPLCRDFRLRVPCYAFVEFEDPRHAKDAIHGWDGYNFDGNRLRVELAHGGRGHSSSVSNSYVGGGRRGGVSKHSEYRVLITGLPSSASWQDLKFCSKSMTICERPVMFVTLKCIVRAVVVEWFRGLHLHLVPRSPAVKVPTASTTCMGKSRKVLGCTHYLTDSLKLIIS